MILPKRIGKSGLLVEVCTPVERVGAERTILNHRGTDWRKAG